MIVKKVPLAAPIATTTPSAADDNNEQQQHIAEQEQLQYFRWCKINDEWCVTGENSQEHDMVSVYAKSTGNIKNVILGKMIAINTFRIQKDEDFWNDQENDEEEEFRWTKRGQMWYIRGASGMRGETVSVENRNGEITMVFLYKEIETGVYEFERCE